MKTILITGASGLLGKAFLERINGQVDINVFAVTSKPEKIKSTKNVTVVSNEEIETVISTTPVDVFLQLAFPRNVSENEWAKGIKYAIELLFLAYSHNIRKVVNISSQSIYGLKRKYCANEQHDIYLFSPYSTGKYCTEIVAQNLFDIGKYTNIRLATIIGESTKERVPNKFFSQIVDGKNIVVQGGSQLLSFLDVRDAADGLFSIVMHDRKDWKPIYNLGTKEAYSLLDVAEKCLQVTKRYGYVGVDINVVPDNSILNNQIDTSLFENEFSWKVRHSFDESLEWIFQQNYVKNEAKNENMDY